MANTNDFQHHIAIPVPLGEHVYTFWTRCCDACSMQHRHNKVISCKRTSPCHTIKYRITPIRLTYENLQDVLENWGTFYFSSSSEAEAAGNKRIQDNILAMRDLGYAVDDDGTARHIFTIAQAREYNKAHYGHEIKCFATVGKTFKEAFLDGDVSADKVNDYVELWHKSDSVLSLREFLGMNESEYAAWCTHSDNDLSDILGKM